MDQVERLEQVDRHRRHRRRRPTDLVEGEVDQRRGGRVFAAHDGAVPLVGRDGRGQAGDQRSAQHVGQGEDRVLRGRRVVHPRRQRDERDVRELTDAVGRVVLHGPHRTEPDHRTGVGGDGVLVVGAGPQGAHRRALDRVPTGGGVQADGAAVGDQPAEGVIVDALHPAALVEEHDVTVTGREPGLGTAGSVVDRGPATIDLVAGVAGDARQDLTDLHRVCVVVDERDDREDRHHAEQHRHTHGEVRDDRIAERLRALDRGTDRTQHHQAVGEGADREAHDPPVERIPEQALHHPRRVLGRRLLDDQERHRERDAGHGDGRRGHDAEDLSGAVDRRGQHERQRRGVVLQRAVEVDQRDTERAAGEHEQHRDEEETAAQTLDDPAETDVHVSSAGTPLGSMGMARVCQSIIGGDRSGRRVRADGTAAARRPRGLRRPRPRLRS